MHVGEVRWRDLPVRACTHSCLLCVCVGVWVGVWVWVGVGCLSRLWGVVISLSLSVYHRFHFLQVVSELCSSPTH